MANWSYSGAPYTGLEKVRAIIGDTDTNDRVISDYEIEAVLAIFTNETEAAAHICRNLGARFAKVGDVTIGPDKFLHINKAKFFSDLSKDLFREVYGYSRPLALAGPSFGGISQTSKDSNTQNTDNVEPKFYRGQFENPGLEDQIDNDT